jgi:hypothetical protein
MMLRTTAYRAGWTAAVCVAATLVSSLALAAKHHTFPVPPGDEIQVLDPNAHPLGWPAVELWRDHEGMQVDIPPSVLVHKYYYTGDRSFQAQLLPGGPVIIVVTHPKTGERCYVQTQMLPGAPRVTYTARSIEYDYGSHGMTLHFGLFGQPKVHYRSRKKLTERVGTLVHAEQFRDRTEQVGRGARYVARTSSNSLKEAVIDAQQIADAMTLPVQNLLRLMPLGAAALDPDRHLQREEVIAEYQRQRELQYVELETRRREQTMATIR